MKQYLKSLWDPVNNDQLVLFRILFGLIMTAESFVALLFGWVKVSYIDLEHNFSFIGFEFLQVLHGRFMYCYFGIMLISAMFFVVGFGYRINSFILALL